MNRIFGRLVLYKGKTTGFGSGGGRRGTTRRQKFISAKERSRKSNQRTDKREDNMNRRDSYRIFKMLE